MEHAQTWTRAIFSEQLAQKLQEGKAVLSDRPVADRERMANLLPFLEWLRTESKLPIRFFEDETATIARIASMDLLALLDRERKQDVSRAALARNAIRRDEDFDIGNPVGSRCTVSIKKDHSLHLRFYH